MLHVPAYIALNFVLARAGIHTSRHRQPEVVPGVPDDVTGVADEIQHEMSTVNVTERIGDPEAPRLFVDLRMLQDDEGLTLLQTQQSSTTMSK